MNRLLMPVVLGLLVTALVSAQDDVTYHDRVTKKTNVRIKGTIKQESPAGVKVEVKEGKKLVVKQIAAADIQNIVYKTNESPIDYRKPFGLEARALAAKTTK